MCAHSRFYLLAITLTLTALFIPAGAADVDKYLPDDSDFVASLNVRELLDAPVVKKHALKEFKTFWERDDCKPRLTALAVGIDVFADISRIVVGGPMNTKAERGLSIVRGHFDVAKIHAALTERARKDTDAIKIHAHGDQRVYEFCSDGSAFGCVLDKETIVLSTSKDYVLEAIAKHRGKKTTTLSKKMQALVDKMDGKQTLWLAVLATEDLKKTTATTPQTQKIVGSIQTLSGGVTLGDGLRADFVLQTNDARAAAEIRKLSEGIKSLLILAAGSNEAYGTLLADLAAAVKLAGDKEVVTLKGQFTAEQIEESLKTKPEDKNR